MSRIEEALRRASQKPSQPPSWEESEDAGFTPAAAAAIAELPQGAGYSVEEPAEILTSLAPGRGEQTLATDVAPFGGVSEKLIVGGSVLPVVIEQYRKLAVTLHQLQVERGTKTVMVASAMPAEGKTLTAANIALTLSESLRRSVLLIDADLRRPTIHQIFQIPNVTGLSDGLSADQEQKLTLVQVSPHLCVLPAGRASSDPMSGLSSDRMREIIEESSARFDWVVIDTPPVGLLPDANLLAKMVDAVVLVIGAGVTPYRLVERAITAIDRKRIVGVVLNRAVQSQVGSGYYNYNYAARS
jgi:receptor protein-tyrosine kinase